MTNMAHIVRNQDGHYWGRGKRWVDGRDTTRVMSFSHQDEAVNTVFELSSKDVDLRCDVLSLNLLEGKLPKLEISSIPLPAEPDGEGDLEIAPLSTPFEEDKATKEKSL
jgi:hypothetical protein